MKKAEIAKELERREGKRKKKKEEQKEQGYFETRCLAVNLCPVCGSDLRYLNWKERLFGFRADFGWRCDKCGFEEKRFFPTGEA